MNTKEAIARSLQQLARQERSATSFAKRCGVSPQCASNWLRAKTTPDVDTLNDIAKIYNVSLTEMFSGEIGGTKYYYMDLDENMISLSENEQALLRGFNHLTNTQKQLVLDLVMELQ